jgi:hypothetical protein
VRDRDVVGEEPVPPRQTVPLHDAGAMRLQQRPRHMIGVEELRQLRRDAARGLHVAPDEVVSVDVGPAVDEGGDSREDEIAAESVVVEHRAVDVVGGERRGDERFPRA